MNIIQFWTIDWLKQGMWRDKSHHVALCASLIYIWKGMCVWLFVSVPRILCFYMCKNKTLSRRGYRRSPLCNRHTVNNLNVHSLHSMASNETCPLTGKRANYGVLRLYPIAGGYYYWGKSISNQVTDIGLGSRDDSCFAANIYLICREMF